MAQSPKKFDRIEELDDEDRQYLRQEAEHRWRQPKLLYFTIFLNSVAAAIQGWDQTGRPTSVKIFDEARTYFGAIKGSNGANLSFPQEFGIAATGPQCDEPGGAARCDRNSWIVGVVNATPYIAIAFLYF